MHKKLTKFQQLKSPEPTEVYEPRVIDLVDYFPQFYNGGVKILDGPETARFEKLSHTVRHRVPRVVQSKLVHIEWSLGSLIIMFRNF